MAIKSAVCGLFVGLLVLVDCGWAQSPPEAEGPAAQEKTPDESQAERDIVAQINAFRREQGLRTLRVDPQLSATAADFASYMADTDHYGHTADGREPWERTAAHGYRDCIIAENIAFEYRSDGFETGELAGSLVRGWENSPPHRRNILDPDVYDTGVGIAQSRHTGKYYAVQLFGRPKSKQISFQIVNDSPVEVHYAIGKKSFDLPPHAIMTHQVCRPPTVEFQSRPNEEPARFASPTTLYPRTGDQLVIETNPDGDLTIRKRPTY